MNELGKRMRRDRLRDKASLRSRAAELGTQASRLSRMERGTEPVPAWMLERLPAEYRELWLNDAIKRDQARREGA